MPQQTALVLKDLAGTDHSFVPKNNANGVATFVESTGVPVGDKILSSSTTRTNSAQGRFKAQVKLAIPVVQDVVVAGISRPTVVRTAYADVTFTVDPTSNTAERTDLRILLRAALADPQIAAQIDRLEPLY